jgi:predicted CxxxxCH...CXXCH cytochrome family protein
MNNVRNLNLDPNEPGLPAGTLKGKNGSPVVITQNPGVSVICSSVYCHSDGYSPSGGGPTARDYGYKPSPDWYGGSYSAGACNGCHGNSPTGSSAHGKHAVGIHYKTVFTGDTGLIKDAAGRNNAHGDANTSTTISCYVCHNATVTTSANDLNTLCATCHTGASLKGTMTIAATSTSHVNGMIDVAFAPISMKSKAQVRDDITAVTELTANWTRVNGYKVSGSHDESVSALNTSSYTGGNCTVSCHNGFPVQWTSTVTCTSCHTALPQ